MKTYIEYTYEGNHNASVALQNVTNDNVPINGGYTLLTEGPLTGMNDLALRLHSATRFEVRETPVYKTFFYLSWPMVDRIWEIAKDMGYDRPVTLPEMHAWVRYLFTEDEKLFDGTDLKDSDFQASIRVLEKDSIPVATLPWEGPSLRCIRTIYPKTGESDRMEQTLRPKEAAAAFPQYTDIINDKHLAYFHVAHAFDNGFQELRVERIHEDVNAPFGPLDDEHAGMCPACEHGLHEGETCTVDMSERGTPCNCDYGLHAGEPCIFCEYTIPTPPTQIEGWKPIVGAAYCFHNGPRYGQRVDKASACEYFCRRSMTLEEEVSERARQNAAEGKC